MDSCESDLIQRARHGDPDALVALYERHQPSVFTYVYYRVGDQVAAEDLTAEVFARMVKKVGDYTDCGRPILAWLYTIARNLIADHYRVRNAVAPVPLEEALVAGETGHPAIVAEYHLAQECLAKALRWLTEEQRQLIMLRFVEDREVEEVAAIMGKNERAIRSLQHRALAALHRAVVKEGCYEP